MNVRQTILRIHQTPQLITKSLNSLKLLKINIQIEGNAVSGISTTFTHKSSGEGGEYDALLARRTVG